MAMERVKSFFAGLFGSVATLLGSAMGVVVLALVTLSLPLNVIAVMQLLGWEWWSALVLVAIYSTVVPIIGQLAYVFLAFFGAYYFWQADFNWHEATNSLPKTFSVRSLSPQEFTKFKHDELRPQLYELCLREAERRVPLLKNSPVKLPQLCGCYAQATIENVTQLDMVEQERTKVFSPATQSRLDAAIWQRCLSSR
jgi:hypothetical protein